MYTNIKNIQSSKTFFDLDSPSGSIRPTETPTGPTKPTLPPTAELKYISQLEARDPDTIKPTFPPGFDMGTVVRPTEVPFSPLTASMLGVVAREKPTDTPTQPTLPSQPTQPTLPTQPALSPTLPISRPTEVPTQPTKPTGPALSND